MIVSCIWEHNGDNTLLYSRDYIGAYTRGKNLQTAKSKMKNEILSYCAWSQRGFTEEDIEIKIVQDHPSTLQIQDADSDVIFHSETESLTLEEYNSLRQLALKSAEDFQRLYDSIPDKDVSSVAPRKTFYGWIPTTARQMYEHTKNVNEYYFSEINVPADNLGTILECRKRGFTNLEAIPAVLASYPVTGSYDEIWSVRKVIRRFLWHDRIHAKAMYRMAVKTFGEESIDNPFHFDV